MGTPYACGPPPPETVYTDLDTAVAAIQGHAKLHGYALCKRDSKARRIVYTCDRFGATQSKGRNPNTYATKRRPGSGSKKCGCKMKLVLKLDDDSEQWAVSIAYGTHNHESSTAPAAHPIYRTAALDPATIAAKAIQQGTERISVINGVEVFTQDAEYDLSDTDL